MAAAAGVSTAAVSFVLNGRLDQVSAATRERVKRAAAQLGYHPSAAARAVPFVVCAPTAGEVAASHAAPSGEAQPSAFIGIDYAAGIRAMLDHLTELGHRRVAFATHQYAGSHAAGRLAAFRRETARRGLSAEEAPVATVELSRGEDQFALDAGREAARALAASDPKPTAVLTAIDMMALGVLRGAWELGWQVPAQLSVAGFDDTPYAAAAIPPLTTVRVPWAEIGAAAAEALIEVLSGSVPAPRTYAPQLVVRNSTAAPARAELVA